MRLTACIGVHAKSGHSRTETTFSPYLHFLLTSCCLISLCSLFYYLMQNFLSCPSLSGEVEHLLLVMVLRRKGWSLTSSNIPLPLSSHGHRLLVFGGWEPQECQEGKQTEVWIVTPQDSREGEVKVAVIEGKRMWGNRETRWGDGHIKEEGKREWGEREKVAE